MTTTVLYYEQSLSWGQLFGLLFSKGEILLVNTRDIRLPDFVVDEIHETSPERARVVFEIKVNPALDSKVRVYRIKNKWLALPFFYMKGFKLYEGALRRALRLGKSAVRAALSLIRRPNRAVSSASEVTAAASATDEVPCDNPGEAATAKVLPAVPAPQKQQSLGGFKTHIQKQNARLETQLSSMMGEVLPAGFKLSSFVLVNSLEHLKGFGFPASLHVALTTHCNLKCVMCPYHSEDLRKQHTTGYFTHSKRMPAELFDKLLEEAGRHGTSLSFGQYDEPFIYKDFVDYVEKAKRLGCHVSITTNGTLLTEEYARRLIKAGVDHISFSLDAATEETYRKIRLDDYSLPMKNIKKLAEVRDELQGKTVLRACLVVQDGNRHEQDCFRDRMKAIGLDMVSYYVLSKYENGIWINEQLNFDIELPDVNQRHACSQLWTQAAVYPDGNVALCCGTTMYVGYREDIPYVGNIQERSLEEIWLSSNYQQIRNEALLGVFRNSVCRDCQIWHNYQSRKGNDAHGHVIYQNAYETLVYFRDIS